MKHIPLWKLTIIGAVSVVTSVVGFYSLDAEERVRVMLAVGCIVIIFYFFRRSASEL